LPARDRRSTTVQRNQRIAMEALVNDGVPCVYLCLTFFLQFPYLPNDFLQLEIIPLVTSKSGDSTNVNNYRAIAISNVSDFVFSDYFLAFSCFMSLLIFSC